MPDTVINLQTELETELREMLTQIGGSLSLGIKWSLTNDHMSSNSNNQVFTLTASIEQTPNFKIEVKDQQFASYEENWKKYVWKFPGLDRSWLGKTFSDRGRIFTIVGLTSSRRNKWPVMCHTKFGTWRRFSVNRIQLEMAKNP